MILNWYHRPAARELAAALLDNAASLRVVDGGIWAPEGWPTRLRQAITGGEPMTLVRLRHADTDRILTDGDWTDITRRLAHQTGLHATQWLAVRTGAHSALILATTAMAPPFAALRELAATIRDTYGLTTPDTSRTPAATAPATATSDEPTVGTPMRLLDARRGTTNIEGEHLIVLVDHIPDIPELRFTEYPVVTTHPTGPGHPDQIHRSTLYVAVDPGGYQLYLLDSGNRRGFNGATFHLPMTDGTIRTVIGPWSSNPDTVAHFAPDADVYHGKITFHTSRDAFHDRDATGYGFGTLTATAAHAARTLADRHERDAVTSLAAMRGFIPLRQITLTPPSPPPSTPPHQPPPGPHR